MSDPFDFTDFNPAYLAGMADSDLVPERICFAGNYDLEQVIINVNYDCDLYDYVLVQINRNEEDIPDYGSCHFLTFDELELKEGDQVVVMTNRGKDESYERNERSIHVIHWNLATTVWDKGENEVAIMERGNMVIKCLNNSKGTEN